MKPPRPTHNLVPLAHLPAATTPTCGYHHVHPTHNTRASSCLHVRGCLLLLPARHTRRVACDPLCLLAGRPRFRCANMLRNPTFSSGCPAGSPQTLPGIVVSPTRAHSSHARGSSVLDNRRDEHRLVMMGHHPADRPTAPLSFMSPSSSFGMHQLESPPDSPVVRTMTMRGASPSHAGAARHQTHRLPRVRCCVYSTPSPPRPTHTHTHTHRCAVRISFVCVMAAVVAPAPALPKKNSTTPTRAPHMCTCAHFFFFCSHPPTPLFHACCVCLVLLPSLFSSVCFQLCGVTSTGHPTAPGCRDPPCCQAAHPHPTSTRRGCCPVVDGLR